MAGDDAPHEHHDHSGERRTLRHYAGDFLHNWSDFDGPAGRKVWLVVKNRSKAFTIGGGCCGHPGEPGC